MRSKIFKKIMKLLDRRDSGLFTRIQLQILLNATANAFALPGKRIWSLSAGRALHEYAVFTADCMKYKAADTARLYDEAYRTGKRIRRITGFTEKNNNNIEKLIFLLYRNIRIDMSGHIPGKITVSHCYFSEIYTPEQCRIMSFMDSGIMAGLLGGGKLEFTGRITEGCGSCTALFKGDNLSEQST